MSKTAEKPWTLEAFFAWQERQEDRYELVGGFPLKMMTGAKNRHDDVVVRILAALVNRLDGMPCQPFSSDGSVETFPGQIRRPDIGVDCGSRDPDGYRAALPTVVVEVLSPSTRDFDSFGKVAEYKSVASIQHIALIEPNFAFALLWTRKSGDDWEKLEVEGLDATIELPAIGVDLPLADVYRNIVFPDGPLKF